MKWKEERGMRGWSKLEMKRKREGGNGRIGNRKECKK